MNTQIDQSKLTKAASSSGLYSLSKSEQDTLYTSLGLSFVQVVLARLALQLQEEQVLALEQYIEEQPDIDQLLHYLEKTYPAVQVIIAEELKKIDNQFNAIL